MKQAIEEGFILDVLKNYTSYEMAAKIAQQNKDTGDDEEIDIRKGTKTLIKFVELHPTNISSKVAVILDHYTGTVKSELGGKAKPWWLPTPVPPPSAISAPSKRRFASAGYPCTRW